MAAIPPTTVTTRGYAQQATGDVSQFTPNGATIPIAPADPTRVSLLIALALAGNCWVGPIAAVANGLGANLSLCGGSLTITAKDFPGLVGAEWWAFAPAGVSVAVATSSIPLHI